MTDMQVRLSTHRVSARRPCEPLPKIKKPIVFLHFLGNFNSVQSESSVIG
jgi:hypothetical protein